MCLIILQSFRNWPEFVEGRAGDAVLIEVVEPTFAPYPSPPPPPPPAVMPTYPPPPAATPSYPPPPAVMPSYPAPPPYVSPTRPGPPSWDPCSSKLEFVVQVSFGSPETADVVSIPEQVDRATQTCYDKIAAEFGGASRLSLVVSGRRAPMTA